jgi:hypothetical protein
LADEPNGSPNVKVRVVCDFLIVSSHVEVGAGLEGAPTHFAIRSEVIEGEPKEFLLELL